MSRSVLTVIRSPLLAPTLAAAGCGPSEPPTYPVTGRVQFRDERPVTSGVVEFMPDTTAPSARGAINPDGTFRLTTGSRPGAVAGTHRVAIVQLLSPELPAEHVQKHKPALVHRKFTRHETSNLIREVEAKPNEFVIEVDAALKLDLYSGPRNRERQVSYSGGPRRWSR